MKRITTIITSLIIGQLIYSQAISGIITDNNSNLPLQNATVMVVEWGNGKFVNGTSTNSDGYYELKINPGRYKLQIEYVGYKSNITSINLIDSKMLKTIDIKLFPETTLLEEVNIVAENTTIKQLIDKKVIYVGKDILSAGGSAATVLNQLPEIKADEIGNISLRGGKSVNILINGKPSALSTSELLHQIQASEINKIEIITSPSAKYRADGITGIINIITKNKIKKGKTVSVNTNINTLHSKNIGAQLNYGKNKINYRFGGSFNTPNYENTNSLERKGIQEFVQHTDFKFKGRIIGLKFGIDLFPNINNDFSIDVGFTNNSHKLINNNNLFIQNNSTFNQKNINKHIHKTLNINTNYRYKFSKENHFIEVDIQRSDNSNKLNSVFIPYNFVLNNKTNSSVIISNFALDYNNPISGKFKIESGYLWNKNILNNRLISYNNDSSINNKDEFDHIQEIHAIYGISKITLKKVEVQVGLRGEYYQYYANLKTHNIKIDNSYTNLFPSVHLNYKLKDDLSLTFGYSSRTTRPSLHHVNPIVTQTNEYSLQVGNPQLIPEFSHNIEISSTYKMNTLTIIPLIYYRLKNNNIESNYYIDNEEVTVSSYSNQGDSSGYGLEFSLIFKPLKWCNLTFDTNLYFEKLNQTQNNFANNLSKSYGFSFRNILKVNKKLNFDISWRYYGAETGFYSSYKNTQTINLGVLYKIFKNANLNVSLSDAINSLKWDGTNVGEDFVSNFMFKPKSRIINLSFSYILNSGEQKQRNKKSRNYDNGVLD